MPHRPPPCHRHPLRPPPLALCLTVTLALLAGCGQGGAPESAVQPPPPAVVVVPAREATIEEQVQFIGRVAAVHRVDLQARVQGFLKERKFTEGQQVQAGELLYLIEPEQYQAVVRQREADLVKAVADEQNARTQLARNLDLLKQKNVSQASVDELQAKESIAKASIAQAQAALDAAKLDLDYTRIIAPVSGRIGFSKYSVGNLVGPTSGTLATIVSSDPIYVQFPVTQRDVLESRRDIEEMGGDPARVTVLARLPDDSLYDQKGKLDFIDVTTERGTDTVTVRAVFPNPKGVLVDGQYVGVVFQDDKPVKGIVVPQSALQVDQQGNFVLIVTPEHQVEVRRIETGPTVGADVVVRQGLAAGELVITEGIQKVRAGMVVATAPSQAATQSPQGALAP